MTAHTHSGFVAGCYRCELGLDEVRAAQEDAVLEAPHGEMCAFILTEDDCDCGLDEALLAMWWAGHREGQGL